MQFTQRQRFSGGKWRSLLAALPVGLLLGFAGPFGTYPAFPTASRYAFWLGMTLAGAVAAIAADVVLPRTGFRYRAIRVAAVALVSALPMTFVVAWTMSLIQPGRSYAPVQMLGLFWGVAAVQLLVALTTTMTDARAADATESGRPPEVDEAAPQPPPAFPAILLGKLPAAIGRDIIALETEDHYLRIHTAGGSALILMRMADAVALLDPRLGGQVHRRWWVAEQTVSGLLTEGQKLCLRLDGGMTVPVGRTYAATARARFGRVKSLSM